RDVFDFFRIADHRCRDGSADIDIEAAVLALAVGHAETRNAGRYAAAEPALLELVDGRPGRGRQRETERGRKHGRNECFCPYAYHADPPFLLARADRCRALSSLA